MTLPLSRYNDPLPSTVTFGLYVCHQSIRHLKRKQLLLQVGKYPSLHDLSYDRFILDNVYVNKPRYSFLSQTGWGTQYYGGPASTILMEVTVPIWPQELCIKSFTQRITKATMCAGAYKGGRDACQVRIKRRKKEKKKPYVISKAQEIERVRINPDST